MHLEVRTGIRGKRFYLAHSYRKGGKVCKARLFLGSNLSSKEIREKTRKAVGKLRLKVDSLRVVSDPLHSVLSLKEKKELENLVSTGRIDVFHLTEDDWRRFSERFAFDTNAIEGSTITEDEVEDILEKNKWPDKPKEEISETYGVAEAIGFIRKTKEHVSLKLILELHRIVFKNSKKFAGNLRPKGVEVGITDGFGNVIHRGAPSTHLKKLISELVDWYKDNKRRYHPLVLAAIVHNQFENIHPFQDGNGRVGRLLLNNVLLKHGLPPLNIRLKNRQEYYESLQAFEKKHDLRPTIKLFLKEYKQTKKTNHPKFLLI
ncbi:MAG: Fic family protein [Candidatus Micrarchaeia archaeon]